VITSVTAVLGCRFDFGYLPLRIASSPCSSSSALCALQKENGAKLGQVVGRVFELGKDDRPLIDREREQLQLVGKRTVEPVCKLHSADGADYARELRGRLGGDGDAREHHRSDLQRADNADLDLSQAPQPTSSCVSSFRQIV
jgi:hypothetical protein